MSGDSVAAHRVGWCICQMKSILARGADGHGPRAGRMPGDPNGYGRPGGGIADGPVASHRVGVGFAKRSQFQSLVESPVRRYP